MPAIMSYSPKSVNRRLLRTILLLLVLLPLLPACGGSPDSQARGQELASGPGELTFPLRTPFLEFGALTYLFGTDADRVLTLTAIVGTDWARLPLAWSDIEPAPGAYAWGALDGLVNAAAAHDLKLLVAIGGAPGFAATGAGLPHTPQLLGDFVAALAGRYGNRIAAYEIWGGQNLAGADGTSASIETAGDYAELLAECYRRIKAITPEAYVLAGAPTPTSGAPGAAIADESYYQALYSYKDGMIKQYFDAQAVHLNSAANPPDTLWPDRPGPGQEWTAHQTFYFRHVENIRRLMVEAGLGDHQIWITEFGWATANATPGYEFGNQITFEQQADYLTGALARAYTRYRDADGRPWVGVMIVKNMNLAVIKGAAGAPDDGEASFSLLNPDWSPRPAFLALQGFLAETKKAQGR
jgi:polysaccharide biosynthesis protein PslG